MHRCLDERPAEVRGSILRQRAAAVFAAGLVDTRTQARVPAELFGRGESRDIPDLGRDGVREHPADPGDGHEVRDVRVLGAQGAQLTLTAVDLGLELVDEPQACLHRPQLRERANPFRAGVPIRVEYFTE